MRVVQDPCFRCRLPQKRGTGYSAGEASVGAPGTGDDDDDDGDAAPSCRCAPSPTRRFPAPIVAGKQGLARQQAAASSASLPPHLDGALRHASTASHGRARIHSRRIPVRHPHSRHFPRTAAIPVLISRLPATAFHGHLRLLPGRARRRRREWHRWPYGCAVSLLTPPLQQSDAAQLLGDSYQPQYGTLEARPQHPPQPDPEEIRRAREELEQICADTSR